MDQVDNNGNILEDQPARTVFEITVASSTVQLTDRRGDASYSARNLTSQPLLATAKPVVSPPTLEKWLAVDQPQRTFSPGVLEQIPVHIQVPSDAPAGTYGFRLDVTARDDPDENFARGPNVTFAVAPAPTSPLPPPWWKRIPWWVFAIAAAAVLVIAGVVAFLLLRNVTTPNVVGQTLPNAQATLQAASLSVGQTTDQATGAPEQTVLRQSPGAATPAPRNSAVDLVVEAARVQVPNVVSQPRATATQALTAAGLMVGNVTDQPTGKPPGTVLQQNPAAGTPVLRGSAVNLVLEAPLVTVPNVIGQPQQAAVQILTQAGLRVGAIGTIPQPGVPPGIILSESPGPGTQVLRGATVNLVTAAFFAIP